MDSRRASKKGNPQLTNQETNRKKKKEVYWMKLDNLKMGSVKFLFLFYKEICIF